jgi:hypothetical protein
LRPDGWRGPARLMKTVAVGTPEPRLARWPEHLPVGALRVVRWSARYDQTVIFYRDTIGLPVLATCGDPIDKVLSMRRLSGSDSFLAAASRRW